MRIVDSRRLTGPSLLLDVPGAILDVALEGADASRATLAWREALHVLLLDLGWPGGPVATRAFPGGLSLAFAAPEDVLYAATEVNEAAWASACGALGVPFVPQDPELPVPTPGSIRDSIAKERKSWLAPLAADAAKHRATLLADDERVSVGLGTGSRSWPIEESEAAIAGLSWDAVHDVPLALVTGTNGKTTTIRLLGAMARAAGLAAGTTSTDSVTVGDEVVAEGDYSGPSGARTALRDPRVEIAMLEVARGGILRRGLAVPRATAAVVTNVANDHLGEYGVFDLDALADTKLVVAKAVGPQGRVVLNADDALLLARGVALAAPVTWFTLDPAHPVLAAHLAGGGDACVLRDGALWRLRGAESHRIAALEDVPVTMGGAARHNVANALAAIGAAVALGLNDGAIRAGLAAFDGGVRTNPGRANLWRFGTLTAIVDFAHNPHGLAALAGMAATLPAARRAVVIGQAGDRSDDDIRAFARSAWATGPQHVFIKELEYYLRGREFGSVPAVFADEFRRLGVPADAISTWPDEVSAIRAALAWAREGDLLLLTTHAQRPEVTALLERMQREDWRAGTPLPDDPA